jgi:hypothetical protein
MNIKYEVTVEVDQEGYDLLRNTGYADWQIKKNVLANINAMFAMLLKHWHRAIYDIKIEEKDTTLCQNRD